MTNMMMNGVVAINGGVGVMEIRQPLPQTVESVAQPVENLTVNAHISLRELKNTVAAVIEKKLPKYAQLNLFSLEMFENIAYIMAKHAHPDQVPDTPDEWLENFNTFSIYQILPQLIELWGLNVQTEVEARKNLAKVSG